MADVDKKYTCWTVTRHDIVEGLNCALDGRDDLPESIKFTVESPELTEDLMEAYATEVSNTISNGMSGPEAGDYLHEWYCEQIDDLYGEEE